VENKIMEKLRGKNSHRMKNLYQIGTGDEKRHVWIFGIIRPTNKSLAKAVNWHTNITAEGERPP